MIPITEFNNVSFLPRENNRDKMKKIWQKISHQEISYDTSCWRSIIEKNPDTIRYEIANLIKGFLVCQAEKEFGSPNSLEDFFGKKENQDYSAAFDDLGYETELIIEQIQDGQGELVCFKKIVMEKPVFLDQILVLTQARKESYLLQYGNKKNIFTGKPEVTKAIFGQKCGQEYRFTCEHEKFSNSLMDKIALYRTRKKSAVC